jgi:preprotein translocase SecE subunit
MPGDESKVTDNQSDASGGKKPNGQSKSDGKGTSEKANNSAKNASSQSGKRRVRPAPTVREQQEKAKAQPGKKVRRVRKAEEKAQKPAGKVRRTLRWIVRHTIPPYFRNSFAELRNVTWPDRKLTLRLTWAVVMFAVVFAVIVGFLDWGLNIAFKHIILNQ